jgi:hypothetical protein
MPMSIDPPHTSTGIEFTLTSLRFSVVSGGVLCIAGCAVTALALPGFLHYDAHRELQT